MEEPSLWDGHVEIWISRYLPKAAACCHTDQAELKTREDEKARESEELDDLT